MTSCCRFLALLITALAVVTGTVACASRPEPEPPPVPVQDPASAFPAKVTVPGHGEVTLLQQPKRLVSLSPTATESLYAIGAGREVVATDQASTFPSHAPRTALSAHNADVASVLSHRPDLVIAPDTAPRLIADLRTREVPVLVVPTAHQLEDAYQQIVTLGMATGHTTQATGIADRMRAEISTIMAQTPKGIRPLTYFHEAGPDRTTITSDTFVAAVYRGFGMVNIAGDPGQGTPQLTDSQIVNANPDLVLLADTRCCQVTAEKARQRPGWSVLTAGQNGRMVELDDGVARNWGPRTVELVRKVSEAIKAPLGG